jgi:hypothetical protein
MMGTIELGTLRTRTVYPWYIKLGYKQLLYDWYNKITHITERPSSYASRTLIPLGPPEYNKETTSKWSFFWSHAKIVYNNKPSISYAYQIP